MTVTATITTPANPADQPQPLVQLRGVSKRFGALHVLDKIDLNIYPDEAIAIIGPSGTGKSTILRIIAGLLAPDDGEVWIGDRLRQGTLEDAGPDPFYISLVFQHAALFDSLTVGENVGFMLYEHSRLRRREIDALVDTSLEQVGLKGIRQRYPAQLSGGMQKRVSFARSLISDPSHPGERPRLVLYDEPTAGLDPISSTIVEDLMVNLRDRQSGSSFTVVTHQGSTIRRTVDRVIFLYQGQIRWQGHVSEIDRTENPYVRQFFAGASQGPIQPVI